MLVEDWHKHQRQRIQIERFIKDQLYKQLEEIYDNATFREKSAEVYNYFMNKAESGMGARA